MTKRDAWLAANADKILNVLDELPDDFMNEVRADLIREIVERFKETAGATYDVWAYKGTKSGRWAGKHPALGMPYGGKLTENLTQARAYAVFAAMCPDCGGARDGAYIDAIGSICACKAFAAVKEAIERGEITLTVDQLTSKDFETVIRARRRDLEEAGDVTDQIDLLQKRPFNTEPPGKLHKALFSPCECCGLDPCRYEWPGGGPVEGLVEPRQRSRFTQANGTCAVCARHVCKPDCIQYGVD